MICLTLNSSSSAGFGSLYRQAGKLTSISISLLVLGETLVLELLLSKLVPIALLLLVGTRSAGLKGFIVLYR